MHTIDYIKIGDRIRENRLSAGLTQEQLANKIGISLNFLGRIECGDKRGSFETYVKIVHALDISIDELL